MDEEIGALAASVLDAAPDGMFIVDVGGAIRFANRQATELFRLTNAELVGSSVDNLLPDSLQAGHRAHRLRYRAEPKVRPMGVDLLLRARRGDGTEFPVEVSLSPLTTDEGLQVVVAVRDVSARVEAEDRMRRVLRTLDASQDAVFIMDADTLVFTYVNEGASRQVGYSREELLRMTPMHLTPTLSEAELRQVITPLRAGSETAVSLRADLLARDGTEIPTEMSMQSAPPSQDGSVSVIAVARDVSVRLAAEAQMQRSERAMREAEQVMAVAEDRERIARDLHDTVIQRLFAAGLQLQALTARVDPELVDRMETVVNDLDETIREIRTAIFALSHSPASESGLRGRILAVVQDASDGLGFEPRLQFEGPVESMDERVADHLLPTLREALANVVRHAAARNVRVIIEVDVDDIVLVVSDDGVGHPGEVLGGHGILNMTNRATELGGRLRLESVDPHGTRLVWSVPAQPPAPPARPAGDLTSDTKGG